MKPGQPRSGHCLRLLSLLAAASLACSGGETTDPPAVPDAGPVDGPDAAVTGPADAGLDDSGSSPDDSGSSPDDSGTSPVDAGEPDPSSRIVPLFDPMSAREPALMEDNGSALITRFADRGRDRHARESQFRAYEHYLPLYWEHRTIRVEIIDTVAHGGDTITFNVSTEWKLHNMQAELRFFYRGLNTVAEYHDNGSMTPIDDLNYTRTASYNPREGRVLQVGDKMEFEISQFLDAPPRGRTNYYGTTYLYVAGQGIVPWIGSGPNRDSVAIPVGARQGGATTLHANESNEPEFLFSQMATNLAPLNGQKFVRGRRVIHTSFVDGTHDESAENPVWSEHAQKAGPNAINTSCNSCHPKNGRALPPEPGMPLNQFVVKLGTEQGLPDPQLGAVLQPMGAGEPAVRLAAWQEQDGLRRPSYAFDATAPEYYSARISPQLVGLGLLEAIDEADVAALADPDDLDGDGISGRMNVVMDVETSSWRLGRFGWKAGQPTVRQQTAGALRTDMGVLTSVYSRPDCGASQSGCGPEGAELGDEDLDDLVTYVALLGVPAQRDFASTEVQQGGRLFEQVGCTGCHVAAFTTSQHARHAELRAQAIMPYTDLLLHDMGPDLADTLPEGEASGAEWRTPPLWGIGFTSAVSEGQAYLHDGRARSLEEAITWHGGESEASKDAYFELSAAEQARVLRFLQSL